MQVVTGLKRKTVAKFAKSRIAEGASVKTDAYHSCESLLAEKYLHEDQVFDADSDMLKWLHTIFSTQRLLFQALFAA